MAGTESATRSGKLSRARIIEIAFEHFASNGYRGSSLGRIAAEVGISQPGLLHHFPNKAALFHAVLAERDARSLAVASVRAEELAELPIGDLLEFFARVVRHNADNRHMVQLAHLAAAEAAGADHPAHGWVTGRVGYLREVVSACVRKGIEAGDIHPDIDPDRVAALLVAASEGLENQWLLDSSIDLVASFDAFLVMLRRELKSPGHLTDH